VRALVVALGLLVALPAGADVEAEVRAADIAPARQARREHIGGTALTVIGALNATLSLAAISAIYLRPPCGPGCGMSDLGLGAVGIASGLIAVPALAVGITLQRMGDKDAFAASQSLPGTLFIERATRRRRTGKALAIAGGLLIGVGIGFAGGTWQAFEDYHYRNQFDAMAVLSSATGGVGVALLAAGTTMYLAGR
jgi:hypothetical protein